MPLRLNLKLNKLTLLAFLFLGCFYATAVAEEWRGVWIKKDSLNTSADVAALIDFAKEHHLNHLFVQVYAQGQFLNHELTEQLTQSANEKGLTVHAWFNIFNVWSQYSFPKESTANEQHVYYAHPNWFLCDSSGKSLRDYSFAQRKIWGAGALFLDPGHREVQEDIVKKLDDFVSRYPVAGIHLDYFRYPGKHFLACEQDPPNLLPEITSPREENVTIVLRKIEQMRNEKHPKLFLSSAVIADRFKALDQYAQDWGKWLKEDRLDFVVLMAYDTDRYKVKKQLLSTQKLTGQKSFYLYGVGAWRLSSEELIDRIYLSQRLNASETPALKGFVLFAYDHLKNKLKPISEQ